MLEDIVRRGRFDRLWPEYRLRYVVITDVAPVLRAWPGAKTIGEDGGVAVFDVSALEPRP